MSNTTCFSICGTNHITITGLYKHLDSLQVSKVPVEGENKGVAAREERGVGGVPAVRRGPCQEQTAWL